MTTRMLLLTFTLCAPGILAAQPATPAVPSPPALPKWDIHGTLHIQDLDLHDANDLGGVGSGWYGDEVATIRVAVGRYLTTHVKADASVNATPLNVYGTEFETRPLDGGGTTGVITSRDAHVAHIAAGVTYQFLDNVFTHPFVSAGVTVDALHGRRYRQLEQRTVRVNGVNRLITIEPVDETLTSAILGGYIAAGAKCYFNDWVFARPEAGLNFGRGSATRPSLSFGIGVDF